MNIYTDIYSMIRDLKTLLVVVLEDKVLTFSTNYEDYIKKIRDIDAISHHLKSDSTIRRYFKKNDIIIYLGMDRKIYTLQKLL